MESPLESCLLGGELGEPFGGLLAWRRASSPAPPLSPPKQSRPIAAAAAAAAGCCKTGGCCCCWKKGNRGLLRRRRRRRRAGTGLDCCGRPVRLFQGQPLIMARSVLCCRLRITELSSKAAPRQGGRARPGLVFLLCLFILFIKMIGKVSIVIK